jgi:nucleotide-binding universal stress UspA family protein
MYDHILIPVDLSSANKAVFSRALQLGRPDQTDITLLHVIETLQDDEPGEMDDFYEELREEANAKMTDWAAAIAEEGFEVEATITYGERGPEITRVAEERGVDLIVQRSHRIRREDGDTSVGTVSHQVAIFAPCSVLLVRPEDR